MPDLPVRPLDLAAYGYQGCDRLRDPTQRNGSLRYDARLEVPGEALEDLTDAFPGR
ncbi:MAG: hypothetical protein ACRDVP_00915 [Acidimicrobiales bacterium]